MAAAIPPATRKQENEHDNEAFLSTTLVNASARKIMDDSNKSIKRHRREKWHNQWVGNEGFKNKFFGPLAQHKGKSMEQRAGYVENKDQSGRLTV